MPSSSTQSRVIVMVILLPSSLRTRSLAALRTVLPEVRVKVRVRVGVKVRVWVRALPSPILSSEPSACFRKSPLSPRVKVRVKVRVRVRVRIQVRVRAKVTYVEVVVYAPFSIFLMDFQGAQEKVVVPGRL